MDRRLLPGDWRKRLQLVHRRVEEAAQQQPAPATLQADQKQNYWAVASLRDRLAGSAPRTLLGGLTGPAAAWDSLVRAYESGSEALAIACTLFIALLTCAQAFWRNSRSRAYADPGKAYVILH